MNERSEVRAEADLSFAGQRGKLAVSGIWAAPAGLFAVCAALGYFQGPANPLVAAAFYSCIFLFGVTTGVAYTSVRVRDAQGVADERKQEIDRMAEILREYRGVRRGQDKRSRRSRG